MKTLSIAYRNIVRNRRRSLTTLLSMAIGLGAVLIFGGYSLHAIKTLQTGYVQLHGHFQIQQKDYFLYGSDNPQAYGIPNYQQITDAVRVDPVLAPALTVVTPKLQFSGIIGNFTAGLSVNVVSVGIDADAQNIMRQWDDYDSMGYTPEFALHHTANDAIVIGNGVARKLRMCAALNVPNCGQPPVAAESAGEVAPADISALSAMESSAAAPSGNSKRVEMLSASAHGAPNVVGLNVVKSENWGLKEFDDTVTVMHLPQAQRLIFGNAKPQVTAIQIQLHHTSQMPAVRQRLEALLATTFKNQNLGLVDYETLAPVYGQSIQFFNSVILFISSLIAVIVLFTVGNTMSMAIFERTTEIGTLRAMGLRRRGIHRVFVCEGLLLGLIGAVLGILSAMLIAALINKSGFEWIPPGYVHAYPIRVQIWSDGSMVLN